MGKTHSIKDCKVSTCGISGCDKKHNRLLHEQKGDNITDVQQEPTNSYSMPASSGLVPIVRVTLITQTQASQWTLAIDSDKEMSSLLAKKCR